MTSDSETEQTRTCSVAEANDTAPEFATFDHCLPRQTLLTVFALVGTAMKPNDSYLGTKMDGLCSR
jgi:hypothetical protein